MTTAPCTEAWVQFYLGFSNEKVYIILLHKSAWGSSEMWWYSWNGRPEKGDADQKRGGEKKDAGWRLVCPCSVDLLDCDRRKCCLNLRCVYGLQCDAAVQCMCEGPIKTLDARCNLHSTTTIYHRVGSVPARSMWDHACMHDEAWTWTGSCFLILVLLGPICRTCLRPTIPWNRNDL